MNTTRPNALKALARAFPPALALAAAVPLNSLAQTINVDFNSTDGSQAVYAGAAAAPDTGTIWNALPVGAEAGALLIDSVTSEALVTSKGEPTGVTVTLGSFKVYEADERPAALAPDLFAAFVYQQTLGTGGPDSSFAINNLDPGQTYDLYFYAQNAGYAATATIFKIGDLSKSANNAGNGVTTFTEGVNYVVFFAVAPDSSGVITGAFNDAAEANNAAFTGLQIVQNGPTDPPRIIQQPARQRVPEGGTATFTVSATGGRPLRYEWSKNGELLPGQTEASLTLELVTIEDAGTYRVRVTNDFGLADSDPVTLKVLPPPVRAINVDFNTTDGTLAPYAGTGASPDGGTTWNGFAAAAEAGPLVVSATSDALVSSAGEPTPITVTVSNVLAYEANESLPALAPELMGDFLYQRTLGPSGPDSAFAIHNLNPLLTYDVYLYGQNGGYANTVTKFTIGGVSKSAANAGNAVSTFTEGVNYVLFAEVAPDGWGTIAGTFNDAAPANNAAFTGLQIVQYEPDPTNAAPGITVQPVSQTAKAGDTITFLVGVTGTGPLTYQWSKDGTPLEGKNTATLTLGHVTIGDQGVYRLHVVNGFGVADTDPVTLTLNDVPPTLTGQPASQTAVVGEPVTLAVSATGSAPLLYLWSKDGALLEGRTTPALTLDSVTPGDAGVYTVRVTNAFGFKDSEPATLTVINAPAHAVINVDFKTTDGSLPTYSSTAAAPDQGTTWNRFPVASETSGPITSITSDPLVSSYGLSTPVTVTVGNCKAYEADDRPSALAPALLGDFLYQPNLGPGGPDGTFAISGLDPSLTYDLYLYAQNGGYAGTTTIFNLGEISKTAANGGNGVTTFTEGVNYVLFAGVAPDETGTIAGTFNDGAPNDNAAFAGLQIAEHGATDPPAITTQPAPRKVVEGSTVSFTVSATGTEPLSYGWTKDGSPAGNGTATLTLENVTAAEAGLYRVRVSNNFGYADSDPALLTVVAPPVLTINVDFNTTDGTQAAYAGAGAALDLGTTWNPFAVGPEAGSAVVPGITSDALVSSTGAPTPVTVALGNFKAYEVNERPASLAPDLMTEFVYQQTLGTGGPDSTFAIHNLDPTYPYDVYLYSQNGGYASTVTIFTIGGVTKTVTNGGNSVAAFVEGVNYALFTGLAPNPAGTIAGTFNCAKANDNAAFTGIQIVQAPATPPKLSITRTDSDTLSVSWTPADGIHHLESAPTLNGPWKPLGTASPVTVETSNAPIQFFRIGQ